MTTFDPEHLAELLRHHDRPLYAALILGADSWELLSRPALQGAGAEYAAVRDHRDGQLWLFSDAAFLKDLPGKAVPLPTAAPGMVRQLALYFGAGAFELSAGWAAGVRRLAALLPEGE